MSSHRTYMLIASQSEARRSQVASCQAFQCSCSCSSSQHLHFTHWLELVTESRPNPYILQEFRMSKLDAVKTSENYVLTSNRSNVVEISSKDPDLWLGRQAHILYCLGNFGKMVLQYMFFSSHLFTIWYLGLGFWIRHFFRIYQIKLCF